MKKHELLVPAGDMACLKQAVMNGADAVYGGCQNFGARKFAKNFTNEEIVEAIKFCHLYDVKFYVTMNTLVRDSEVTSFLEQVEFLYNNGVDAILMQDFGMICYVLKRYPNLEVHASTQFNSSSYDTIKILYDLGVKRVVLPREMSLEEIEKIDIPIEKEVFVHGALCICYSGCCLMSSMIGGRSGNRGECAGACRLPYRLYDGDKLVHDKAYLLSTKELNTCSSFNELLDSNIYSFKIEGRMKSPEYVGFITRLYRELIDSNGKIQDLDLKMDELKTIFNREFTLGHLFDVSDGSIINNKSPNHIGLEIGKVLDVKKDKICIKLNKDIHQGDGIRFLESGKGFIINYLYNSKGMLVSSVSRGEICFVDNKISLTSKDTVSKTSDYLLMEKLKKLAVKKIPITFYVKAHIGEEFCVEISDGERKIKKVGSIVQQSITSPVTDTKICTQLEKLGETPFVCQKTSVESDQNIFISLREINEIRRSLVSELIARRCATKYEPVVASISFEKLDIKPTLEKTCLVYNKDQLETCLRYNFLRIYTPNLELFQQYQANDKVFYVVPRCVFDIKETLKSRNLVRELYSANDYKNVVADYTFNVFNIYTAYYLYNLGFSKITLSVELNADEIRKFYFDFETKFGFYPNIEVVCYGKVEDMVIKGNILNLQENNYQYFLIDLHNCKFPVYFSDGLTTILNFQSQDVSQYKLLKDICSLRFDFYDESNKLIGEVVKKVE